MSEPNTAPSIRNSSWLDNRARRISNTLRHVMNILLHKLNSRLDPAQLARKLFILYYIVSTFISPKTPYIKNNVPIQETTKSFLTVPEGISPNTKNGAAISPKVTLCDAVVKMYSGLKAFMFSWRADMLLATIATVRVSAVQNCFVWSKTVWLKTWLLPKNASWRLEEREVSQVLLACTAQWREGQCVENIILTDLKLASCSNTLCRLSISLGEKGQQLRTMKSWQHPRTE